MIILKWKKKQDTNENYFSDGSGCVRSAHANGVRRNGARHRDLEQPYREKRKDRQPCRSLHSAFLCRQSERAEINRFTVLYFRFNAI